MLLPVALTSAWAMVGAKAPPRISPRAWEIETPEKRTLAGKMSWPQAGHGGPLINYVTEPLRENVPFHQTGIQQGVHE